MLCKHASKREREIDRFRFSRVRNTKTETESTFYGSDRRRECELEPAYICLTEESIQYSNTFPTHDFVVRHTTVQSLDSEQEEYRLELNITIENNK